MHATGAVRHTLQAKRGSISGTTVPAGGPFVSGSLSGSFVAGCGLLRFLFTPRRSSSSRSRSAAVGEKEDDDGTYRCGLSRFLLCLRSCVGPATRPVVVAVVGTSVVVVVVVFENTVEVRKACQLLATLLRGGRSTAADDEDDDEEEEEAGEGEKGLDMAVASTDDDDDDKGIEEEEEEGQSVLDSWNRGGCDTEEREGALDDDDALRSISSISASIVARSSEVSSSLSTFITAAAPAGNDIDVAIAPAVTSGEVVAGVLVRRATTLVTGLVSSLSLSQSANLSSPPLGLGSSVAHLQ